MSEAFAFGPVPSRRLGRSLGVNNIPPKVCTYSCVYCQLGKAVSVSTQRRAFYPPEEVAAAVQERLRAAYAQGQGVDYITVVPDGEPTLDLHLGRLLTLLKRLGVPVAVITSGSLLWQDEVRSALCLADWVSLKADAAGEGPWRRVDRPHRALRLSQILRGMAAFREQFGAFLATETMLVWGANDSAKELEAIADLVASLRPDTAYIAVPVRPPAESWVLPAAEGALLALHAALSARGVRAELLTGYEGNAFSASGDAKADLLSITAVHPMRRDAVEELLRRDGADWGLVHELLGSGILVELEYGQERFYLRKLPSRPHARGRRQ